MNSSAVLRCLLLAKLKQMSLKKSKCGPIFLKKSMIFEQFSINSIQKTQIEQLNNRPLSLEMKSITVQLTISTFCKAKLTKIRSKIQKM